MPALARPELHRIDLRREQNEEESNNDSGARHEAERNPEAAALSDDRPRPAPFTHLRAQIVDVCHPAALIVAARQTVTSRFWPSPLAS